MRKHGIFIVSQVLLTLIFLQKAALDPCTSGNYQTINSSDRLVGNTNQSSLKCDMDLIPGWYRFTGDAGDKIPNTRPPHTHRCGTHAPGWINGNNPAVADGEVNRTVCYFWSGNNCSWNNNIKIKNCGAFYVYELQKPPFCSLRYCGEASECSNYTTLDQADRAVGNTNRSDPKCDRWDPDNIVSHKWYRMTGDSGDQIPERCVPIDRCGTRAPGWLNGTHPTVQDGLQTAQVCYHWNNDCCQWKNNIKIRNCSSYFVYQLVKHPACNLRYCVCAVITPMSDTVITEGAHLTLSCQATGVFPPTVFWVKTSSGQRTNGTELVLKNISRNEAGEYRCEARNLCGNASESAKIDVQFPAVIVPLVDRIIVQKGDDVKLFCNASGTPPPSVMWTHVHTGRKQYSETWLFTAIQVGDLGEYRCDANNTYGHATDSVTIELEVPAFIVPFVDKIIVQKGDDVPLFCNASGTPPLFVMWSHVPTGRKQYSKTWLITAIQVDDLGEYRCDANNNYGHATDSVTIELEADGPIVKKETVNVTEGGDTTLNCTISKEAASPKWSREDGDAVQTQSRVLKDEETRLRITSASVRDAGIFNCESDNIKYIFIVRVKVLVKVEMAIKVLNYQYTPALRNTSSEIFKETAKNFTAEMDIVYKNTPGYVRTEVLNFTKGSVKVDFRVIIIIVATDPKNESTITDKKAETGQRIIRKAETGFVERLKVSPDVEIKAPPPDPRNVEIFDVKSDELSVRWIPPKDVKYFDVYEYKVQHRRFQTKDVSTSDIPASEGRDKYSYRIQNLEPKTTYMISVAAVNEYGSNFNDESGHLTLEPPLATWIILLIVLGVIFLIATIIGSIVCFRRKAAERRRRQAEEGALEVFGNPRELDSVFRYEEKNVKGLKFSFVNDSYKPSDVNWTEIPYENINLMDELGSGAFGVVYRGEIIREKDDVTPCAVKAVKASASHEEIRDLYNELEIMTNVGYHPNLVNLLGACTKDGNLLVVLEIAENGSLLDFLKKSRNGNENYEGEGVKRGGLTEDMKLRIATDVAKGMAYLASHRCIHRDLAARNVLLGENFVAKVADYGMARDVYESLMYKKETQGKLPVKWMAIESLETYVFTVESDIWSYGVLLWEIESGGLKPYAGMTTQEIMTELKKGYRLEKPSGCSDAMYQVMRDCWNPNPKLRPSFEKLVERLEAMV